LTQNVFPQSLIEKQFPLVAREKSTKPPNRGPRKTSRRNWCFDRSVVLASTNNTSTNLPMMAGSNAGAFGIRLGIFAKKLS